MAAGSSSCKTVTGCSCVPTAICYIVPFNGGKARLMNCNTALMNSWHTFSPNGRWMAFSSKARSPYTRLMLTHIDANGNDTPAIIVDNTTAANRAVNIPEFLNVPSDGLAHIDPEATNFFRYFNQAYELMENNRINEAVPLLRQAVASGSDDPIGHYALATALAQTGEDRESVDEYRKALALNSNPPAAWYDHLAVSLTRTGDLPGAAENLRASLKLDPSDAGTEDNLGTVLCEMGQTDEGFEHLRKAIAMASDYPEAYNHLGWELAKAGQTSEAVTQLNEAIQLRPSSVEYRVNLGYVLAMRGDFAGAVPVFEKAVELSEGKDWRCLDMLAGVYAQVGRTADAVRTEKRALDLAAQQHNEKLEQHLASNLARYEQAATQVR